MVKGVMRGKISKEVKRYCMFDLISKTLSGIVSIPPLVRARARVVKSRSFGVVEPF
jgi:hypothetical protein